jgi:hypothetical protein
VRATALAAPASAPPAAPTSFDALAAQLACPAPKNCSQSAEKHTQWGC